MSHHRKHLTRIRDAGLLLHENSNWPGSFFVNICDERWTREIIETQIPSILRRSFDGIFMDALDNPGELERIEAKKFAGAVEAARRLVVASRRQYPNIKLMMNRG